MSTTSQIRRRADWEAEVPRCESCVSFVVHSTQVLPGGKTLGRAPSCKKLGIETRPGALCKHWIDRRTGDTLK